MRHLLACGPQYAWCADRHVKPLWALAMVAIAAVVVLGTMFLVAWLRRP